MKTIQAAALFIFLLGSRLFNLFREIAPEEGVFIQPGRNFFQGKGYTLYLGETLGAQDFLCNPFHKPVLTSLVSGMLSFLTPDPLVGPRLFPFLVGAWIVFLPYYVTRSWIPSWILALSPFFFRLSGHVQTDSTVGLLGYSLVVLGIWREFQSTPDPKASRLWGIGLCILFLGKLEIAVQASILLVFCVALKPAKFRIQSAKALLRWVVISGIGYLAITALIGSTTPYGVLKALIHSPSEIIRIAGSLDQSVPGLASRRQMLWDLFKSVHGHWLGFVLLIPIILGIKRHPRIVLMILAAAIPFIVYFKGAYIGDGFPRYFAIVFPSLAIVAGYSLSQMAKMKRIWVSSVILILSVLAFSKSFGRLVFEKGSVASGFGSSGMRLESALLLDRTNPGDLIIGSESLVLYLPDRKLIIADVVDPYPERHKDVTPFISSVKAGLFGKGGKAPEMYAGPFGKIRKSLEERGAVSVELPHAILLYIKK